MRNDDQVEVYLPNDGSRMTDPLNRYQQVGGRDFEYDAKGNLLSDGVNTYSYDYQNRQTGISGPGGVAEYVYDARGRRVANEIDGSTIRVVFNTSYQELEEWSSDAGITKSYVYGAGVDGPLIMDQRSSSLVFHGDALGSISELTNENGQRVKQYMYEVYGTSMPVTVEGIELGSETETPYRFSGRRYDAESGNYQFRALRMTRVLGDSSREIRLAILMA